MKKQVNDMIDVALSILDKAKEAMGKAEIKIYLTSLEQIFKQIKETNTKDDRNKRSKDTKQ
tara:strand:- start:19020 stop:19202 length:183 start_codon:yes stop_codon:yes gene_type:complete